MDVCLQVQLVILCSGHWSWQSNTRPMWTPCWHIGRSSYRNLSGRRPTRDSCSMPKGWVRDPVCRTALITITLGRCLFLIAYTSTLSATSWKEFYSEGINSLSLWFCLCRPIGRACVTKPKMGEILEVVAVRQEHYCCASFCKKSLQCEERGKEFKRTTLFRRPVWSFPYHRI